MVLAIASSDWLGLAALIASFTGVIATIFSVRYSRKDATKKAEMECHDRLLKVQRDAEKFSEELYNYRMQQYGGYGENTHKVEVDDA